jgi:ABC-type phosphate transport system permease subunit
MRAVATVVLWLCGAIVIAFAALAGVALIKFAVDGLRFISYNTPAEGIAVGVSLLATLQLLAMALPVTAAVALGAAIAATRPEIGGGLGSLVRTLLPYFSGMPSVVAGVGVAVLAAGSLASLQYFQEQPLQFAALGIVALSVGPMTARFRNVLEAVPRKWYLAGAAAGASNVEVLIRIAIVRSWRSLATVVLRSGAAMIAATAAIAVILGPTLIDKPLSVHLFDLLNYPAAQSRQVQAVSALVLVACIVALRSVAALVRRGPGLEAEP